MRSTFRYSRGPPMPSSSSPPPRKLMIPPRPPLPAVMGARRRRRSRAASLASFEPMPAAMAPPTTPMASAGTPQAITVSRRTFVMSSHTGWEMVGSAGSEGTGSQEGSAGREGNESRGPPAARTTRLPTWPAAEAALRRALSPACGGSQAAKLHAHRPASDTTAASRASRDTFMGRCIFMIFGVLSVLADVFCGAAMKAATENESGVEFVV
mmetsp:Transcript_29488/g.78020  ORF Transcript_29488/g.78020 Transcript_29488/m.78020 type:complete len:211 (+) Transcript_29488:195-827(+)